MTLKDMDIIKRAKHNRTMVYLRGRPGKYYWWKKLNDETSQYFDTVDEATAAAQNGHLLFKQTHAWLDWASPDCNYAPKCPVCWQRMTQITAGHYRCDTPDCTMPELKVNPRYVEAEQLKGEED